MTQATGSTTSGCSAKPRVSNAVVVPRRPAARKMVKSSPALARRRGDLIVDRVTFEIPRINTIPGPHEIFIGVQRNPKKNLEVALPEGHAGEFGVTLRGRNAREFANLGVVEID